MAADEACVATFSSASRLKERTLDSFARLPSKKVPYFVRSVSYLNIGFIQDVEDEGEVVAGLEGKRVDVLSHHVCAPRI